jgi:hypothetical protein
MAYPYIGPILWSVSGPVFPDSSKSVIFKNRFFGQTTKNQKQNREKKTQV